MVWRIRDLQFGRDLAVKVMASWGWVSPQLIQRFIVEAKVCAQLTHPFIVPVHSMGRLADGRPYYTMKLVEGQTLAALLEGGAGTLWTKQDIREGSMAQRVLSRWVKDPDLAGVRDPVALAKLPEEERREWQSLWQQLERHVGKASK